jgi:CRISPR-associated protein Cmr1
MPSITFDLETVTPLFLSGANQQEAELRPPAFRGALRYWFRAIAGAYYWNEPNQLKEIESALLGDSGTHGGSKIILRLSNLPDKIPLDPVQLRQEENPGLSYLLFSMKGSGRKNSRPQRRAIGVRNPIQFSLTLSARPNPKNLETQRKNLFLAANCFWQAVNLGGFGSRERRGVGSLRVIKLHTQGIEEELLPKFIINFKPESLPKYFQCEIIKTRNLSYQLLEFNKENMPVINRTPNLEISSKYTCRVFFLNEPHDTWQEALETLGLRYKSYRQSIEIENRAIFGLPLMNFDMNSRRPSPLRIKVIRVKNNYYCLLSYIKANFPDTSCIDNPDNPSYSTINDFISSFDENEIQRVS